MNDALWHLLRRVAARDQAAALELLDETPALATQTATVGASREEPDRYFLDAVSRHVYAGDTALHIAAAAYQVAIARALVTRGADVMARNRRGATPLHSAALGSPGADRWNPEAQAATIDYLIDVGADPNAPDKDGVTPLHKAIRCRCARAVELLLTRGADHRLTNRHGSTPFDLAVHDTGRGGSGSPAARQQQREIIRLLEEAGD